MAEPIIPIGMFYAINPAFRPLPQGTQMYCLTSTDVSIISFETLYDMFNDKKCTRFIAWDKPVPYTTPLTMEKTGDTISVHVGSKTSAGLVIYVLFDPRVDVPRVGDPKDNFLIVDSKPQFLFSKVDGRCVPDPKGQPLDRCMLDVLLTTTRQPSLLSTLQDRYSASRPNHLVPFVVGLALLLVIIFVLRRISS